MLTILTIACLPASAGTILQNFATLPAQLLFKAATESEVISSDSPPPSALQPEMVVLDLRRAAYDSIEIEPVPVPEPPSFALPGLALIGTAALSRRFVRRSS